MLDSFGGRVWRDDIFRVDLGLAAIPTYPVMYFSIGFTD